MRGSSYYLLANFVSQQCDQMMESKLSNFSTKIAQKIAKSHFIHKLCII